MNANEKRKGFTIVELLTVMGVIAILISLLVPALTLVRDYSKEIQQMAQFHAIDVGLEMYKAEFGSYPPSNDNSLMANPSSNDDTTPYTGANKLAEAMVGLDMLGFHPKSDFRADGMNIRDDGDSGVELFEVYHPNDGDLGNTNGLFAETALENVQARKGPYLDLENANAFEMGDVYNEGEAGDFIVSGGNTAILGSLALCDEYVNKRQSGKKTGMPILYYRARRLYTQQDSGDVDFGIDNNIYFYPDNESILDLGIPEDTSTDHPLYENRGGADDWLMFDNMILNMQVTQIKRPYRADSYILISAGKDGMYGTPDDMYNFEKQN